MYQDLSEQSGAKSCRLLFVLDHEEVDRNTRAEVVASARSVLRSIENDIDLAVGGGVAEGETVCVAVDGEDGIWVDTAIGVDVELMGMLISIKDACT